MSFMLAKMMLKGVAKRERERERELKTSEMKIDDSLFISGLIGLER